MSREHWDGIYWNMAPNQVSWFRQHLDTLLSLIENASSDYSSRIIDIGGGESTLVDDLLVRGYQNLSVLDISSVAVEASKTRLGTLASDVGWITADITRVNLPAAIFDIWHDRAVFHFLTSAEDRRVYVGQIRRSVKPGGHVIIATFGTDGPSKCSGLDVQRYDAESLHTEFGKGFRLINSVEEVHETPSGSKQQFIYWACVLE